jgi:D-arabinose 1-dehydrogenase-like Zn-dependent alcohol dehydrogenase
VIVALDARPFSFDPYRDVLGRERRIIGCSDHTRGDLIDLMEFAASGSIDPSRAITRTVSFDAASIDAVLDDLEAGTSHLRTVVLPQGSDPGSQSGRPRESGDPESGFPRSRE